MGDWWYTAAQLPDDARAQIAAWVLEQEWPINTVLKKPSSYHVTLVYSYDGRERAAEYLKEGVRGWGFEVEVSGVECFSDHADRPVVPVVLTLQNASLLSWGEAELRYIEHVHGFKVSRFEGGYKPHVTVALVPQGSHIDMTAPDINFTLLNTATVGGANAPT